MAPLLFMKWWFSSHLYSFWLRDFVRGERSIYIVLFAWFLLLNVRHLTTTIAEQGVFAPVCQTINAKCVLVSTFVRAVPSNRHLCYSFSGCNITIHNWRNNLFINWKHAAGSICQWNGLQASCDSKYRNLEVRLGLAKLNSGEVGHPQCHARFLPGFGMHSQVSSNLTLPLLVPLVQHPVDRLPGTCTWQVQ